MNSTIQTNTIGKGIAKTTSTVIESTANTKLVFHPMVHDGGVRGHLVRYKKKTNQKWSELKPTEFRKQVLSTGESIEILLKTASLKKLLEEVNKRESIVKDGVEYGAHEYVTIEKNKVIILDDTNKKDILEQILEKGYSDEYWTLLAESLPELANSLANTQLQDEKRKVVYELDKRIQAGTYSETTGDDSWQRWIYKNNWLFGINYKKPIEKVKLNITGIMPDYLFPTLDGFVDILEIKLPNHDVIIEDTSHNGSWRWAKEANTAIGQVINYLGEIERQRLEIERNIKSHYGDDLTLLKPRVYILIGDSSDWSPDKKDGLRKLNYSLHNIIILTYSDLLDRGNQATDLNTVI